MPLHELGPLARRIEDAGYDDVWSAEATEFDGFTPLAVAAVNSERLRLVSGIVNVFTRGPALLAQTAAALADAERRSLRPRARRLVQRDRRAVERHPFRAPAREGARRRSRTCAPCSPASAGAGGFKLACRRAAGADRARRAARPHAAARRRGRGRRLHELPAAERRRAQVAEAFGAPEKELACRFFSIPAPRTRRSRGEAHLRRLRDGARSTPSSSAGSATATRSIRSSRRGTRATASARSSSRPEALVRETFLLGPLEAQRERLAEFAAAGIDTAVLALSCRPARCRPHRRLRARLELGQPAVAVRDPPLRGRERRIRLGVARSLALDAPPRVRARPRRLRRPETLPRRGRARPRARPQPEGPSPAPTITCAVPPGQS